MTLDVTELARQNPMLMWFLALVIVGVARDYYQRRAYDRGTRTLQEASVALVGPLADAQRRDHARLQQLEEEVIRLRNVQERLYWGVERLVEQLESHGLKPVFTPRSWDRPLITRGPHTDHW